MTNTAQASVDWKAVEREQLTVIIPSYRCEAYLPAAVASVLHSEAGKILIADDGSGPEGVAVAQRLAEAHPDRIRVLASPTNRGAAVNVNEAVEHVQTTYFAKLDGDDVLLPGYFEKVFPMIASRPRVALLAGHELRIGADEAVEFRPELLPTLNRHVMPRIMSGAEAFRFIVTWNPNPCSSGVIYRTDAFRAVGGYDPHIRWGEDWEIWLRFARQWEVAYLHAPSALYRIHSQSTTAQTTRQNGLCYGYDAVFRRAAEICEDPDVMPLIRHRMFGVAKLYAAAAARHIRRSRRDSLQCLRLARRALSLALGPATPTKERGWIPPAVEPVRSRN